MALLTRGIRKRFMLDIQYAGDKNMIVVEGDLNSPRPKYKIHAYSFRLVCKFPVSSWALNTHPGMNLMAPPWSYLCVV